MYYPNTGLFHALVINSVLLDIPELFSNFCKYLI